MREVPEFEEEAKRRAFFKLTMDPETLELLDEKYKEKYGHGIGTLLNI